MSVVKNWPWYRILVFVGFLLVVAGITPGAYVLARLSGNPNPKPFSVPVTLKQGTVTTPEFTPTSSGINFIELDWAGMPLRQTAVDLDWKIVTGDGSVIQQGAITTMLRGANNLTLGQYQPTPGQLQKVVLNVHTDTLGTAVNATLKVGPAGESVAFSSDIPVVVTWATWIAGPGALLLIVLLFVKIRRERAEAR
jgi:hypothetical protein